MIAQFKSYLQPPIFEDEHKTRVAQLLHRVVLISLVTVTLLPIGFTFLSQTTPFQYIAVATVLAILSATFIWLQRRQLNYASSTFLIGLMLLLTLTSYYDGGFRSASFGTLLLLLFYAGFLLGHQRLLPFAAAVLAITIGLFVVDQLGLLPAPLGPQTASVRFLSHMTNFIVAGSFSYYVFRQLHAALERARLNELTLLAGNEQLQREIDERKQVEAALAQSNAILKAVFEAVPDGVLAVDRNGRFVAVNGRFRQIWGLPDDIVESKLARPFALARVKDADTFNKIVDESYEMLDTEYHHLLELMDGTILESYSRPQVVHGESVGRVWTYRDITWLKQTEEALRTSEQLFRQLFEHAPIGMAITDLNGRLLQVNTAFCQVLGYTAAELKTLTFPQITYPDDLGINQDLTRQLIKQTIPSYELEKRYVRKDGTPVEALLHASVLRDANGRSEKFVAQVVDLSNLYRAEEALRQAQKMESLGLMSSGIAHDFNNLLTVMLTQASLVEAKLPSDSPVMRHVQRVLDAAKRASTFTQQLLTYSGQREGASQPLSLNLIIQESLHLFQVAIPKNIQINTTLDPTLPLLLGDEGQLQQVMMNLVINAAEAMDGRHGTIHIATQQEQVGPQREVRLYTGRRLALGNYVRLVVSDNGSGMDEATLSKVFDPFFTTKRSGHGLGLATVLGIVRAHQGGLSVTSEQGRGTTFDLYFPVSVEKTAVSTPQTPLAPTRTLGASLSGLVLVVDDETHVRDAVVDVLDVAGIQVITAADGHEGLACYQRYQDQIKAILLDVIMPKMNGTKMLKHLRTLNKQMPVVLSTGYSEPEEVALALRQPNTYFLRKPYRWEELVETIRPFLE